MKDTLILRKLLLDDEEAFVNAVEAWSTEKGFVFDINYRPHMNFKEYLDLLSANEKGELLPDNFVPSTMLTAFVGKEIVGRISIRHTLNEYLFKLGGHIGYGVVPTHRRKGYATQMLAKALPVVKALNIPKVLITCDESNYPSIRVIEKNGGVLENSVSQGEDLPKKLRYWIDLK